MESTSLTQTGAQMGTLLYMSPEQVMDSKNIDYHTDIYSLAVTFVHLLTGKKPYDSDTTSDFQIRERIVYTPYDVTVLPVEWRGFLAPYLEKDPQKRPELRKFEPTPLVNPVAAMPSTNTASAQVQSSSNQAVPLQQEAPKRKSKAGLFIGLGIGAAAVIIAVIVALVLLLKPNPDTKAYEACSSISDYRSYIHEYGSNGLHYNEAKTIVDRYVADSIDKAKRAEAKQRAEAEAQAKIKAEDESYRNCTTIAACDNYLATYPQGRYVSEVKEKKAELEKKAAQEAAAKKEAAKKQIENAVKKQEEKQKKNNNTTTKPNNGQNKVDIKKKTVKVKNKK